MNKLLLTSTQLKGKEIVLTITRIWFGIIMMLNGKFIFDSSNIPFFQNWFGHELHFPAPILMFYLAKGSEFFGGAFLAVGLFSRFAGFFVAFTMFIATVTANQANMFKMDGTITFALMCFSLLFLFYGPGRFSLDYLLFDRKKLKQEKPVLA